MRMRERMGPGERAFWIVMLLGLGAMAATQARGEERGEVYLAGKAGTMCLEGYRYEAVRIDGAWRALCYRKVELEVARGLVGADTSLPSSQGERSGVCMTCPTAREQLEVEALILLWDLNRRGGWYHGPGRWRYGP